MALFRNWRRLPGARWGQFMHSEASAAPSDDPAASLYPPVVASLTAKSKIAKLRRREEYYKSIHNAPTVEEKLTIYGKRLRRKYVVYPQTWALNADRWYQHFTKTVFVPGLPASVSVSEEDKKDGLDLAELRSLVCEVLLQEYYYQRKKRPKLFRISDQGPAPFITQLVPKLSAHLACLNPALGSSSVVDFQPDVHFYWLRGETVVPRGHRRGRIDPFRFQIDDKPRCQIRLRKQLSEFFSSGYPADMLGTPGISAKFEPLDYLGPGDIPVIQHLPDKLPLFKRQYENKIFIGSQISDPCCYGHTQFHLLPDRVKRERLIKFNLIDQIDVPYRANAIASLFAWTGAQAMYQGFWSEDDVTRPFVSQAVIFEGRYFAFFCYQLNTLALTVEADQNNSRRNICWGTESKPLYESIENNDVKGFNDEVLAQLVKLLLNKPKEL